MLSANMRLGEVFPAGAGMNRVKLETSKGQVRVPRRRGDEPFVDGTIGGGRGCSPQARG